VNYLSYYCVKLKTSTLKTHTNHPSTYFSKSLQDTANDRHIMLTT